MGREQTRGGMKQRGPLGLADLATGGLSLKNNLTLETGLGQVTRSQQESPRVPNSPGEPPALATPRNTSPKPASFLRDPAPVPASMQTQPACYQCSDLLSLYS